MQGACQSLAELAVADRLRRRAVEEAVALVVLQQEQDGAHQILDVDPAHDLVPRAHGATEADAIGRQHFGQGTAVGAEHQPDAHDADSGMLAASLAGQGFHC